MEAIKERPIIFSGPMVRAIIEGRKNQTRRVMKTQPIDVIPFEGNQAGKWVGLIHRGERADENRGLVFTCRYGRVGDRLWVRETFSIEDGVKDESGKDPDFIQYKADSAAQILDRHGRATGKFFVSDNGLIHKWKSSIHMPRWASRITLEITGVRVERLQDISDDDCLAELGEFRSMSFSKLRKLAFLALWESINGPDSWSLNPWVWVIEFRRV